MTDDVSFDIAEVSRNFPDFRVALVVVRGLTIPAERPHALAGVIHDAEARIAEDLVGVELADIPELQSWRQAYRAFGVKKTSYRSSVERLLKNLQRGAGLPRVNALVDAYNAISALYRMPIGADDLGRVKPPLAFRYARPTDSFIALGDATATPDPPNAGEVVYADAEKCLCRRWNWYQDGRSAIGPQTTRAVLTVQTLAADDAQVRKAVLHMIELIGECAGGRASWAIASRAAPHIVVADR